MEKKADKDGKIEGEGSYSGTRDYNKSTARFLKKDKVGEAAKEAERALDSREGDALKAAEDEGRAGNPRHMESGDKEKGPAKSKAKSKSR